MSVENEIKELIIDSLKLEEIKASDINDDEALFIDGLGLDSIDALELGMVLRKKYNLKISSNKEDTKKHFYSVKTLANFVRSQTNE